jgi:transcriptional regulator with XRE-family HTH domain
MDRPVAPGSTQLPGSSSETTMTSAPDATSAVHGGQSSRGAQTDGEAGPIPQNWMETIREWRTTRTLGIVQAAARAGVSPATWRAWERGSNPRTARLHEICRRLDLPLVLTTGASSRSSTALTQARVCAGLSGSELARRLVVSPSLVSQWERGHRSPHPGYFPRLATALNIDEGTVAGMFDGALPAKGDAEFAPGLWRERRAAGLTQDALARRAEVHVSTIVAWESCRKPVPRRRITRLAELLDISPTRLLTGQSRRTRPLPPLARIRRKQGVSRKEAAARLCISGRRLERIESRGVVPDELAGALTQLYGISRKNLERDAAFAPGAEASRDQDADDRWRPYTAEYSLPLWTCLLESLPAADRQWVLNTLRRYVPQAPTGHSVPLHGARSLHRGRSSSPLLPQPRFA